MARTLKDAALGSRSARSGLMKQSKPYYKAIDVELHLGYRKGKTGGKWLVRYYQGGGAYKVETFAIADDFTDADGVTVLNFRQAQKRAREIFLERQRQAQGIEAPDGPYTVADCMSEYLDWVDQHRKTGLDFRRRTDAHILPELGEIDCFKLTASQLRRWHDALASSPRRVRTKKGEKQRYRETADNDEARRRRRTSANRVLTILKAALNRAWQDGKIASDDAWRRVRPFPGVEAARVRWLSTDEARRLMNACDSELRGLVHGALATGARYGELRRMVVSDLNRDSGTVHVQVSKSGKQRHVVLNDEGLALFHLLTAGLAGDTPIFRKSDGTAWGFAHQTRPFKAACERAKIQPPASFHVLRHTYASLAIMAGAPLMVVARNLGHADSRMVEKHYGHLAQSYIAETIRATAPTFGAVGSSNVTPLRQEQ